MKVSQVALVSVAIAGCCVGLRAYQRVADFGFGNDDSPTNIKSEFYWSRLAYTPNTANFGFYGHGSYWGRFAWTRDYPKADRQFLIAMHRLTRIDGRPIEQVVTLDSDEIFNYPWIYAVQVQMWSFTDAQAKRLREYLLKGGFLMVDDFHGTEDWENFMNGMRQVLPDRPVEDLQSGDEIFHTLYDVDDKMQIPGSNGSEPDVLMKRTAINPSGVQSETTRGASSSPSAITCTLVMRGNGRTIRIIRSRSPQWLFEWDWITSFTV